MDTKLAIIDLGTNTFHLLIAEFKNKFEFIHRERVAVKLGKGGINQDIIQDQAIKRAVNTLKSFKQEIDLHEVTKVYAFGTSALRNAKNATEIIKAIKDNTGIEVNVISGDKEAELIYHGVRSAVDLKNDTALIIDIGGGSVEFIIGTGENIFWKQSLEIGAQRLLEKFHTHDPITPNEVRELNNYLDKSFIPLLEQLKKYQPNTLVGSSGTFDTLSDIYCIENNISKQSDDPETLLTINSFYLIYEKLIKMNREERMLIPGMIEMRVDMIVVACCLIRYVLEHHTFQRIRVSSYALKEGVLASLTNDYRF